MPLFQQTLLPWRLSVPPDKSLSHRVLCLAALAQGKSQLSNVLACGDTWATQRLWRQKGVLFEEKAPGHWEVHPPALGWKTLPQEVLDCENSGTTARLFCGLLAAKVPPSCQIILCGDASLSRRPMKRLVQPLATMGARLNWLDGRPQEGLPLVIHAPQEGGLCGISWELPVASAQVKSALLLAALEAQGTTLLTGRWKSRDHTERLLPVFGGSLEVRPDGLALSGPQRLQGASFWVPGDFSSAAFWIAATLLTPGAALEIREVGLNPTRLGFWEVLRRMGAKGQLILESDQPEPWGTLQVQASELFGTTVPADEVPFLIDELPLVALLGCFAQGETRVAGAKELRLKETNRLRVLQQGFAQVGLSLEVFDDGFCTQGRQCPRMPAGPLDPQGDHRLAMTFALLGQVMGFPMKLLGPQCVAVSYPSFFEHLQQRAASVVTSLPPI